MCLSFDKLRENGGLKMRHTTPVRPEPVEGQVKAPASAKLGQRHAPPAVRPELVEGQERNR